MSSGKNFVDSSYHAESEAEIMEFDESRQHAASVRLPTDTVALLDALAERFKTSRNAIISDFVRSETLAAFKALSDSDLIAVALAADKNYAAFEKIPVESSGAYSRIATHVLGKKRESSEVAA